MFFLLLAGLVRFSSSTGAVSNLFGGEIARGKHLFPFRTEPLSLSAPMVLGGQPPGRVGRRRSFISRPLGGGCLVSRPRSLLGGQRPTVEVPPAVERVVCATPPEELPDLASPLHTGQRGIQLNLVSARPVGTRVDGRRVQSRVA